jgi:hypothetical protein
VLRFELDGLKMIDKKLTNKDIEDKIIGHFDDFFQITHSDDND